MDREHVATPEGRQPGQETMEPAPTTAEGRNGAAMSAWVAWTGIITNATAQVDDVTAKTHRCAQCGGNHTAIMPARAVPILGRPGTLPVPMTAGLFTAEHCQVFNAIR